MAVRKLFVIIPALCLAFTVNFRPATSYGVEQLPAESGVPETPKVQEKDSSGDPKGLPCLKALLPSWMQNSKTVKSKGFIIELKECKSLERGVVCAFTVSNCNSRDAWLYLDKSCYMSDDSGGHYEAGTRNFGGKSAGEGGFVGALLPSGVTEAASLVFGKVSKDAKKFDVGVVMTGGAWAGDVVKALFSNIKLAE